VENVSAILALGIRTRKLGLMPKGEGKINPV
jgi:hypothetical protein